MSKFSCAFCKNMQFKCKNMRFVLYEPFFYFKLKVKKIYVRAVSGQLNIAKKRDDSL